MIICLMNIVESCAERAFKVSLYWNTPARLDLRSLGFYNDFMLLGLVYREVVKALTGGTSEV